MASVEFQPSNTWISKRSIRMFSRHTLVPVLHESELAIVFLGAEAEGGR